MLDYFKPIVYVCMVLHYGLTFLLIVLINLPVNAVIINLLTCFLVIINIMLENFPVYNSV